MTKSQHPLNLAALLLSAGLAWLNPLYTFLFAYVILGPLHYLTEIAWLDRKNYYCSDRRGGLVYYFACLLIGFTVFLNLFTHLMIGPLLIGVGACLALWPLIPHRGTIYIILIGFTGLMLGSPGWFFFFGLLVPTLVHVYIFTLIFMITGAMREKKVLGWANVLLLVAIPAGLLSSALIYARPSAYWTGAAQGFETLNLYLQYLLHLNIHPTQAGIDNTAAAAVMRLLAFTYMFHYLNWFAKTELLEWHKASQRTWIIIWGAYGLSILLYLINFKIGFYALFFLSLLHVLLEFPLNWRSVHFIGRTVRRHPAATA